MGGQTCEKEIVRMFFPLRTACALSISLCLLGVSQTQTLPAQSGGIIRVPIGVFPEIETNDADRTFGSAPSWTRGLAETRADSNETVERGTLCFGFWGASEQGHQSLHVLVGCSFPISEVDAPKTVLRLHAFDAGLHFTGTQLLCPLDPELRSLRPAMQNDNGSGLQQCLQAANTSPDAGDVHRVCQMGGLIDQNLHRQNHPTARGFASLLHRVAHYGAAGHQGKVTRVTKPMAGEASARLETFPVTSAQS